MSCQNSSRSCNITFNEKTIKAILGYNLFPKSPLPITEASSVSLSVEFTFPTNHFYAAVRICLFCTHIYVVWQKYATGAQLLLLLMHIHMKVRCGVKNSTSWSTHTCIFPSRPPSPPLPLLWRKRPNSITKSSYSTNK